MQGVRVHPVLECLHLLNDLLQRWILDTHVVYGIKQRNAIWETFLHLLGTKSGYVL